MSAAPSPIGELLAVASQVQSLAARLSTPREATILGPEAWVRHRSDLATQRDKLNSRVEAAKSAALQFDPAPMPFAEWSDRVHALADALGDGLRLNPGDDLGGWSGRMRPQLKRVEAVHVRLAPPEPPLAPPVEPGQEPMSEDDVPPLGSPEHPITLNHIGAMVELEREHERFEERRRAMILANSRGGAMDVSTARTLDYWTRTNRPPVARLTKPVAAGLAVYRWLVRTARKDYGTDLTADVLLLILGDVATRTGRRSDDLFALPLDEFERVRTGRKSPPTVGGKPAHRRPLEQSSDEKDRRKANVYRLILAYKSDGVGAKGLLPALRQDNGLVEAAREAGVTINEALFRAAIEYGRRHPAVE